MIGMNVPTAMKLPLSEADMTEDKKYELAKQRPDWAKEMLRRK